MNRNIIIYGSTKFWAVGKLETLLIDKRCGNVKQVKRSVANLEVESFNGVYYKAVCVDDDAKGLRWQYAYIDRDIEKETLNNIIFPNFLPKDNNGKILTKEINIDDYYEWYV